MRLKSRWQKFVKEYNGITIKSIGRRIFVSPVHNWERKDRGVRIESCPFGDEDKTKDEEGFCVWLTLREAKMLADWINNSIEEAKPNIYKTYK